MILELPSLDKVFSYVNWCIGHKEDMERFMTLYALYGKSSESEPAMQHKFGYFQNELGALLERIGMKDIRMMKPNYHFPFRDFRVECVK